MGEDSGDIQCYACGHSYWYIGKGVHLGRCPKCDSYCVSPAGKLSTVGSNAATKQSITELIVLAIDQRHRHYLYQCVHNEDGCKLTALHVEGHIVRPINADIPIPESITDDIEDYRHGAKIEQI